MKGDFTRFSFNSKKHFTQVRKQQGRVDLDADWNEYLDIQSYLAQTSLSDMIGKSGVPKYEAGYQVSDLTLDGLDFKLSAGKIYVDGLLCQLEKDSSYQNQPDDPAPAALSPEKGRKDLVVLDVWQRHLTALEVPEIRETALGGPDTTTRLQTIAQVKVWQDVGDWQCGDDLPAHADLLPALEERGRLTCYADPTQPPESICDVPSSGGYRGLENRLYRVEIHQAGDLNSATFKWSRDNGSVVLAIESFDSSDPTKLKLKSLGKDQVLGLSEQDWVEVLGDKTDLHGQAGSLAKIVDLDEASREIKLSVDVSMHSTEGHPKVRRWDQKSDAIPVSSSEIELEDGIKVKFSAGDFQSGDYWVFAARTALAKVENLTEAPPAGIEHYYTPLAELKWRVTVGPDGGEVWEATIVDCRMPFPPLTKICAEDICYDDSQCDELEADTVQAALDILCQQRNLEHHNKHLHGWGVVCGLQVVCGRDDPELEGDRRSVIVKPGYALDCQGYDIILEQARTLRVLEMIDEWDNQHPDEPLLASGQDGRTGKLDLIIARGPNGQPQLTLRRHKKTSNGLQDLLQGTLLMDFVEECILQPWEEIKERLLDPEGPYQSKGIVGIQRLQLITLLNLLFQLIKPQYGRHIYLSPFEHNLLKDLYFDLREILQSKTFCGMFDDAPSFPDYPFPKHQMNTAFGQRVYKRLRVHPKGAYGYVISNNNTIGVFDLRQEILVDELHFPGGDDLVVQDIAFSADGKQLYAIASSQGADTMLGSNSIPGDDGKWRVSALCGLRLVTLQNGVGKYSDTLLAAGLGSGLYVIKPESEVIRAQRLQDHSFYASGHLVVDPQHELAFATAHHQLAQANLGVYNRVLSFDLNQDPNNQPQPPREYGLEERDGRDDIAVANLDDTGHLYVVCNPTANETPKNKRLLIYKIGQPDNLRAKVDLEASTIIRLQPIPKQSALAISYEDHYWVRLLSWDSEDNQPDLINAYHLPVQISPVDMAVNPKAAYPPRNPRAHTIPKAQGRFYVLNAISGSLTSLPLDYLLLDEETELAPPAGSQAFLNELIIYRAQILQAFVGLAGHLLQSLKDCFCQRFLIDCPTCEQDDQVFLGTLNIKADEVYAICNFSQRQYVHSFPTVEYWLSLLPVIPLVDRAFEKFCCLLLPNLFADFQAPGVKSLAFSGERMRQTLAFVQQGSYQRYTQQTTHKAITTRNLAGDWLSNTLAKAVLPPTKSLTEQDLIGKKVPEANQELEAAGAKVVQIEDYDPQQAGRNLREYSLAPMEIPAGARLKLYQENGVVRYYSLAEDESPALQQLRQEVENQRSVLTEIQKTPSREVEKLRTNLEEMQTRLTEKDSQLSELRNQVLTMQKRSPTELEDTAATKLAAMETELEELRSFKEEVQRFMSKQ